MLLQAILDPASVVADFRALGYTHAFADASAADQPATASPSSVDHPVHVVCAATPLMSWDKRFGQHELAPHVYSAVESLFAGGSAW